MDPQSLEAELAELRAFHAQSRIPRIQNLLQREIDATSKALEELSSKREESKEESKGQPTEGSAEGSASMKPTVYTPITKFGWAQSDKFVSVYISEGMKAVGELPKEQVTCEFGEDWFDLKVHGLNGKNYRLRQTDLEKSIIVAKSRFIVKQDKITIMLGKKESWDHWMKLVNTRQNRTKGNDKDKDPSAAIMDLMRDMYEEGDPEMKKTIAEAWMKSREQAGKTPSYGSDLDL